jgi:hypothetical protein
VPGTERGCGWLSAESCDMVGKDAKSLIEALGQAIDDNMKTSETKLTRDIDALSKKVDVDVAKVRRSRCVCGPVIDHAHRHAQL